MITTIIILFLLYSYKSHSIKLIQEEGFNIPPGEIYEVDGKKLHVFSKGSGKFTFVFLAGHGTSSPTLDFKPLWQKLSKKNRVIVIERSGYGWSEISNNDRDLKSILDETRNILELSGEKPPYILIPHSMSGLEALYWVQNYTKEVSAVIGIDPLIPQAIKLLPKPNKVQLLITYLSAKLGLTRFMPEDDFAKSFPIIKSNCLTDEEKAKYIANFYKKAFTRDMLNELKYLNENSNKVSIKKLIDKRIPLLFFISKEQEEVAPGWTAALEEFLSNIPKTKSIVLDSTHYIHHDKSEKMHSEINEFMQSM